MAVGTGRARRRLANLLAAGREYLDREFALSAGHVVAVLTGCLFAPSVFTFWLVNGLLDFSTALVIGSVGPPSALYVRLLAYLFLVPVFLALRAGYYLFHPVHRRTVLSGSCPTGTVLSLDWFSVGILATGLPYAFQNLGPWVGSNAVYLLGLFVLPRVVPRERAALGVKVGSLVLGTALFLYASYPELATVLGAPPPASVLGPVATLRLSDAAVDRLLALANSFLTGPAVVAALAFALSRLLTRPELTSVPGLRRTLPHRDPAPVVLASAALGTLFYLSVVAAVTGRAPLAPAWLVV